MNLNLYNTKDYENKWQRRVRKNEPNTNPIKPNLRKAKMNISSIITKDYRKKDDFTVRINKPNSKPISAKPEMNVNLYIIEDYKEKDDFAVRINKPNSNPILSAVGGFRKAQNERKLIYYRGLQRKR